MKKFLSLVLALALLITSLCFSSIGVSASTEPEDSLVIEMTMVKGASIRLNEKNGIRFYTKVDTDKIAELRKDGARVELGTLIAPKDLLDTEDLTFAIDSTKYIDVGFEANEYYTEDSFTGIVGSIVNIREETLSNPTSGNITRLFVGRGYTKVTKDGETTISYAAYTDGDISNNSRSLAYVASALKQDTAVFEKLNSEQKDLVTKFASFG